MEDRDKACWMLIGAIVTLIDLIINFYFLGYVKL